MVVSYWQACLVGVLYTPDRTIRARAEAEPLARIPRVNRPYHMEIKKIRCIICGHLGEKHIADYLKWPVKEGIVESICGACIRTYRPDLVWVWAEIANVGITLFEKGNTLKGEPDQCHTP